MTHKKLDQDARHLIEPDDKFVAWHFAYLAKMVAVDSRSFGVAEFEGDRKVPSDMKEILALAEDYLRQIGFTSIKINQNTSGSAHPFPLLLAQGPLDPEKPTILFYAHLDKQPYMDDGNFLKWDGVPPTELTWNADRTRAYGRGAADDLSGVISIGMSVHALLKTLEAEGNEDPFSKMPCNIKIMYETEEECGSHSLSLQIKQNPDFFKEIDCVIITDVVNPATGVPGLTASLRGILQSEIELEKVDPSNPEDPQTVLYKILASLIHENHSLAVDAIAQADIPLTDEERDGLRQVPMTVNDLRDMAGILPAIAMTVPDDKESVLAAQLRKSFANVRPGHRVTGSVVLGQAGVRIKFKGSPIEQNLEQGLRSLIEEKNTFHLQVQFEKISQNTGQAEFDLIMTASSKDPHSGVTGGPFPIAELQIAKMVESIANHYGSLNIETRSLNLSQKDQGRLFDSSIAKAIVEIRIAAGNLHEEAQDHLKKHLLAHAPEGFQLRIKSDKGANPWRTEISDPIFQQILKSLEVGYHTKPCLYGCGGSIPFVPKLMEALGPIPPLCLGAYDTESRMHEPGESLSIPDLLGCTRTIINFITELDKIDK
ncbi:MAG: hypothetical protein COV66_02950 [Nitrospinae bacterium CG11_big_fil_rev_8_21_14_0_20_45_15]|nr:MAG: hypothetical protein COV66_02950 [Nitrospinae bacterium CG11_big_fil_rev_8_21_14_0_20_45_15]